MTNWIAALELVALTIIGGFVEGGGLSPLGGFLWLGISILAWIALEVTVGGNENEW